MADNNNDNGAPTGESSGKRVSNASHKSIEAKAIVVPNNETRTSNASQGKATEAANATAASTASESATESSPPASVSPAKIESNKEDYNAIEPASGDGAPDAAKAKIDEPSEGAMIKKELDDIVEAEAQEKKIPYPKSIAFIISNEFCERFNYYGMRTILVLYLSRQLGYSDDTATVVFHIFTMLVYFLCVFGAIISDSWLGKFKTILYLSFVYVCGSALVAVGAIPTLDLPQSTFTMLGLALIALGSGGIKPCVSAFGGDQFKLPEQTKQMATFFSLFYFAINSGSLISTTVTPILREDVHCFGEKECYSLAFGVPAALMVVSILFFVLGRPLYKVKPPSGNMVVLVSKTISNAISTRWREKKTNPREHWLDYADGKYDKKLIDEVKVLMRVLVLYLPLPVFWALFDQQGSRWTFQATRMDGDMGSWDIKPDQVQMINPLLILVFIPLYDVLFYPLLGMVGIRRPLQKLAAGGILAGISFLISAGLEMKLEETYPTLPKPYNAQIRIYNGANCDYNIALNNTENFLLKSLEFYENKDIYLPLGNTTDYEFLATSTNPDCPEYHKKYDFMDKTAYGLFIGTDGVYPYKDDVSKPSRGSPVARTLANIEAGSSIRWRTTKKGVIEYEEPAYTHNLTEFSTGSYDILIDDTVVFTTSLKVGGVYTFLINKPGANYEVKEIETTPPNSINMLYIIPQYVVLTLGEVMFSVTGLEFSYSQAPQSMKSVLTACWLLTVAFGNVIVIIIAEASLFESQANEFFLFAGLMFVDMIIFMFLAYYYIPNDPNKDPDSENTQLLSESEKPSALDWPGTATNGEVEKKAIDNGIDDKATGVENGAFDSKE